jgi:6-phosphofructokinase 1
MAKTSTKVFVIEVMGRHAGWIAAAGGLASSPDTEIPIVILFPEVPFDEERFVDLVQVKVTKYGYCTVVVSEGVRNPDGRFLAEAEGKDAFGHAQLGGVGPVIAVLIKDRLNYKYHWAVADYLQRAARHLASKTDVEQAYAVGRAAVEFAVAGHNAVMPIVVRLSDDPYRWEVGMASLAEVANVEKKMPQEFITPDGFSITEACRRYLQPLILGEDYPPYRDGLPVYVRLQNLAVPKKLPAFNLKGGEMW